MPRPNHSNEGFLRYMQMSSTKVFIFVEGKKIDSFFFGKICSTIEQPNFTYEIITASRILNETGGKQALLTFFSYLRRSNKLISDLSGKRTVTIFYLDKDVDDILRVKKRSEHLVYTEYYDIENYIFEYGDLLNGAAAAASIDPARLSNYFSNAHRWCKLATNKWRKWVVLCLFVMREHIPCEANYRMPSRIHESPCGSIDNLKYSSFLSRLQTKTCLYSDTFKQRLKEVSKRVDFYYNKDKHHYIFKGKWFAYILSDEIKKIMSGVNYDANDLINRLPSIIAITLDFRGTWADHFKIPLRNILGKL